MAENKAKYRTEIQQVRVDEWVRLRCPSAASPVPHYILTDCGS